MSSAEDTSHLTISPPASSSEPPLETAQVEAPRLEEPQIGEPRIEEQQLEASAIAQVEPEAPQLEEPAPAPELEEPEAAPQSSPKLAIKTNMVAQEVRVTASGAHPGNSADERKLFMEETTSVLVGESGGVIRLSAGVTPGQLLFLTNVESKSKVVVQVKRKRAYRPTSCYVELEFAESAPRFWGMKFTAAAALLPKNAEEAEAAALVISAEATADEPSEPLPAPTVEEVQAFKWSVQALREQPKLMEMPAASEQGPAPAPPAAGDGLSTESNSISGLDEPPGVAFSEKSQPIEHNRAPVQLTAAEEALLPKPSLDFAMSLPRAKRARGSFTPSFRGGILRLALLTIALFITVVGAAWQKHWIPWKSGTRRLLTSKTANGVNVIKSPLPGSQETAKENSEFNNTKVASDAPVTSPGQPPPRVEKSNALEPEPTDATESRSQTLASSDSVAQPVVKRTSSAVPLSGKRWKDRPAARAASGFVAPPEPESVLVPPKLIKSVRAVASLEALRDFETGNVVIDAVVDTNGEVHFISVLSGPPSLRDAAVESLKEYQYEPATRQGQPVPAHVTITIHFRFEP